MERYITYAKKRKFMLVVLAICLVLLSVSEQFLFSHIITQWSRDREIGIFHVLVGIITGLAGVLGIIFLSKKKMKDNERISLKWMIKMFLIYLGLQLIAAVVQGLISEGLGRFTALDYDRIKIIIYWLVGIVQTFIRITIIYIVFLSYYHLAFKAHKKILFKGILIGIIFYALLFILRVTLTNIALQISQILWEVGFIIFFIIYFGEIIGKGEKR